MTIFLKNVLKYTLITAVLAQFLSFVFNDFNVDKLFRVEEWLVQLVFCFVISFLHFVFYEFLNKRLSWETEGLKRMLIGLLGIVVITMLGTFFVRFFLSVVIYKQMNFNIFLHKESMKDYVFTLLFSVLISIFYHALAFYNALQNKRLEDQKIIAGTASAKYDALKNQLDPHFLFNSLNVLISLIGENPKMAEKFTTSLSKVYRYVLEQKNKNLVTVDEELKFARIYMSLLQMRFEDSIVIDIPEASSNPEAKVVPLSLQILLENTVKHNVVIPMRPLYIKIYEKEGFLMVENNLQSKSVFKESTGIGLNNVKQRYQLISKREFVVVKTKNSFLAKLPMLTKKIKVVASDQSLALDTKDLKYIEAQERIKELKDFYSHLISYCIIIPSLAIVNLITNPGYLWFLFTFFGWGIGLAIHAFTVLGKSKFLGKKWEQRKMKEFMQQE